MFTCVPKNLRRRFFFLIGMLLALASPTALGEEIYRFGLRTIPATPEADHAFTLSLRAMTCELFWSTDPMDREVEVNGDVIRVTVEYTPSVNSAGCDPETIRTVSWSIGPFDAGTYTLVFIGDDPITNDVVDIDELPLTIVASGTLGTHVVPTTQPWGLVLLSVLLPALALLAMRGQRS